MGVMIGSARINESGKISGGKAGDQKQTSTPDYKGEVSQQPFYVHKKGWIVLRPKNKNIAMRIASAMIRACNNKHIGYGQNGRLGIIKYGTSTDTDTEGDCSSTVRQCVKEASGKDPGDFNTSTEVNALMKTGLFEKIPYTKGMPLYEGDILVTKTKGHTAIVTVGDNNTPKKSVEEVAHECIGGLWGNGKDRVERLTKAGYDPTEVQKEINRILKGK